MVDRGWLWVTNIAFCFLSSFSVSFYISMSQKCSRGAEAQLVEHPEFRSLIEEQLSDVSSIPGRGIRR